MYLKEIGKFPLITGEEEVRLAQRIEAGIEAQARIAELEEEKGGSLSAEVGRPLARVVADGQVAKGQLTNANLRLVVSIAKRYRKGAMQFLDLIQEGNIGLMRAVDKFDWTKGFKFCTYATWWIRQSITRAIADQSRTIRIPVHMVETINKVLRVQRQMLQELGREPTIEELAAKLEDMSPEKVRDILKINQDTVSLEQPVGDEDDFSLSDTISDDSAEVLADYATRMMLTAAVTEALDQLSDRERDIIRLRFGLDGGEMRTLEEVGRSSASPASASGRSSPRRSPNSATRYAAKASEASSKRSNASHPVCHNRDAWGTEGKVEQQNQARDLRAGGMTLLDIVKQLGVAKSSVSTWVRDAALHAVEASLRTAGAAQCPDAPQAKRRSRTSTKLAVAVRAP